MKILIIRFSSIGDIVLTTPVIRCLRKARPTDEIHFCTRKKFAALLEANPYLDKVHLLDSSLNLLIDSLKAEKYDAIIDLHHNLRTLRIKMSLGVKAWSFNKLNFEKWLYVNFKANFLPKVHIVERYLETVKPLGVNDDGLGLDYFIPKGHEPDFSILPTSHHNGYSVLVIGAQHFTKRLPVLRCIELCRKIEGPIIILGGPEDKNRGSEIVSALEKDLLPNGLNRVISACGAFNLHGSAGIVKNADQIFSNDTGLMHIAAAFGKTIYAIWGNTIPLFGMYPYRTKHINWENNNLNCRPCSKIGFSSCPKGHFNCMNKLVLKLDHTENKP